MLTIQNYYKLCAKPIGRFGWVVGYCSETTDYYEINLEHKHLSSIYVRLQRKKTQMGGKSVYRFTDTNGTPTQQGITLSYIGDINNFLKVLSNLLP